MDRKIKYESGAKFIGLRLGNRKNKLQKLIDKHARLANNIVDEVINAKKEGWLSAIGGVGKNGNKTDTRDYYRDGDGKPCTVATFKDHCKKAGLFNGTVDKMESEKRGVVQFVFQNLLGARKRHSKDDIPKITLKNDTLCSVAPAYTVDLDTKKLHFKSIYGNVEIPYEKVLNPEHIIKNKFGGNVDINQKIFVAQIAIEKEPLYTPKGFLGLDINKDADYWITYSDGNIIIRDGVIKEYETQLRDINKILSDKNLPTPQRTMNYKQRKRYRQKWRKLHSKMKSAAKKKIEPIINYLIDNKLCLCIDSVTTGASNGSFGQDKTIDILTELCKKHRIPYYICPTPNTSKRCNACGKITEDSRDAKNNLYNCSQCKHQENDQVNGAKNIKFVGEFFYNKGYDYGDYSKNTSPQYISLKNEKYKPNFC